MAGQPEPAASADTGTLDSDLLTFRRGVRRDGMPWITFAHPEMGNVVRLSMPSDPEFEKVRILCWDDEEARKGKAWNPGWNQPA